MAFALNTSGKPPYPNDSNYTDAYNIVAQHLLPFVGTYAAFHCANPPMTIAQEAAHMLELLGKFEMGPPDDTRGS